MERRKTAGRRRVPGTGASVNAAPASTRCELRIASPDCLATEALVQRLRHGARVEPATTGDYELVVLTEPAAEVEEILAAVRSWMADFGITETTLLTEARRYRFSSSSTDIPDDVL